MEQLRFVGVRARVLTTWNSTNTAKVTVTAKRKASGSGSSHGSSRSMFSGRLLGPRATPAKMHVCEMFVDMGGGRHKNEPFFFNSALLDTLFILKNSKKKTVNPTKIDATPPSESKKANRQ